MVRPIDRRAPARGVLGDVRGGPELTQLHDEVGGIVGPIGADRDQPGTGARGDQLDCRQALGEAGGAGQLGLDHQAVVILHQHVAHEAEPRFLTMTFAKQPRIRIGGRGVAGVGPVLAVEVSARVATTIGWLVLIILRAEALQAGPGLDQGAVDREVLAAQELPTRAWPSTAARNLAATSPSSSRSRLVVNAVGCQTGSSIPSPTNQRYKRL